MRGSGTVKKTPRNVLLDGVVRIYCTHSEPNFSMPWQRLRQESSTSSGFILPNRQILTNAHAVEYGTVVLVKNRQTEKKYVAKVVAGEMYTMCNMFPALAAATHSLSFHFDLYRSWAWVRPCDLVGGRHERLGWIV